MLFLGFSAGLPYILIFSTLSLWLTRAGVNVSDITMLYWVGLLFATKFAWAPLVDQVKLPILFKLLGRRRSWMMLSQTGILASLAGMGLQNPQNGLFAFACCAIVLAFCAATQDIVIDAYRIESAPKDDQGILAATYMGGYRTAMLLCRWGAPVLATVFNPYTTSCSGNESTCEQVYHLAAWQQTYCTMAAFALVGIITCLLIKEPQHVAPLKSYASIAVFFSRAVVQPFSEFFKRFGRQSALLLGIIAIYRISDIVMGVIANPFYVEMGFSDVEIANITGAFGMATTLLGAALGGFLVSRFGITLILFIGAILASATNVLFAVLAESGHNIMGLAMVIVADNLSAGIATAAFIAFLSSLTNIAFSATQYALFSSLMGLLPKTVAGYSGALVEQWGYTTFFVFTALLGIPTLALLFFYLKKQPNIEKRYNLSQNQH
ncbi:MAG: MFS transporter [Deltaproteobacteria bacterium]|nr:MFS transporter [Deltaproteobacteria bacterium]